MHDVLLKLFVSVNPGSGCNVFRTGRRVWKHDGGKGKMTHNLIINTNWVLRETKASSCLVSKQRRFVELIKTLYEKFTQFSNAKM